MVFVSISANCQRRWIFFICSTLWNEYIDVVSARRAPLKKKTLRMIHSFISATKSDSVFLWMLEIVSNKSKICPFHPLYKQRWHTIFQLSWCIFSQINKQSFFFPFLHIAYYNRQLLFPLKCCLSNSLEKLLTNNTPNKNNKQRTKKLLTPHITAKNWFTFMVRKEITMKLYSDMQNKRK